MNMKPFLPCLTLGLVFLGACGLEKPPASLKFPEEKKEAAANAPAAPVAPAAAPVAEKAPADPKLAAGKAVYDTNCAACHDAGMMGGLPGSLKQSLKREHGIRPKHRKT